MNLGTFSPFLPHHLSKININCGFGRERFSVAIAVRSPAPSAGRGAGAGGGGGGGGEEPVAKLLYFAPYSLRPLGSNDEVGVVIRKLLRKHGDEAPACEIGREKNPVGQRHAGAGGREFQGGNGGVDRRSRARRLIGESQGLARPQPMVLVPHDVNRMAHGP